MRAASRPLELIKLGNIKKDHFTEQTYPSAQAHFQK